MFNNSEFYLNNENLPKAGTKRSYEPWQEEEMAKCYLDPDYFAENYFQLIHPDRGLVKFSLYKYQKKALKKYLKSNKLIMATARQVGKTSLATVIILHYAIFNKNKRIAIIADKQDTAIEVLERIQLAFEHLPNWIKPGVKVWNKKQVLLENNTKIIASASKGSAIRGKSMNMIYIDEVAHIENWDKFSAAVLPVLSSGSNPRMILTSTPKGLNHFFYYCEAAKAGNSDFSYIEVPWWEVDGRDEEWKRNALDELNGDMELFEQEQCVSFIGSSGTLISGGALKMLKWKEPINKDPHLKIYENPIEGHQYIIPVDTSRGKGLDHSAFSIIDITSIPYKQVAAYQNNMITPTDYANIIEQMHFWYNKGLCFVELNDLGQQVADLLWGAEVTLICTENKGRAGKQVNFSSKSDKGIVTTRNTKAEGCAFIKLLIEQKKLEINDKETISEFTTFSKKNNSYEAEPGNNDDLVMSLVIFAWLNSVGFIDKLNDEDILKALQEKSEEELLSELLPLGIIVNGVDDYEETADIIELPGDW